VIKKMKKLQSLIGWATTAAVGLSVGLFAGDAQAKKPGVLEGKPIVVDRLELRKFRVQVVPQVGISLSQPFVHAGMVGGKLRFDIQDWIGVRGSFMYNLVPLDAKLLRGINEGALPLGTDASGADCTSCDGRDGAVLRPTGELDNPAPLLHDFRAGLTRLSWLASADVAFTPFAGKLGLFSAIFTEYDIYVFGGLGLSGWTRHYPNALTTSEVLAIPNSTDPAVPGWCSPGDGQAQNDDCVLHPVIDHSQGNLGQGVRIGGSLGGGLHLFLTDWLAINPEIHDIIVSHNPAGQNATITDVPPRVDAGDNVITHNLQLNFGVTVYLPPKAKRSRLESSSEGEVQKPAIDASASVDAGADADASADDGAAEAEVGAPPPEEAAGDDTEVLEDDEELIEEE
jgi:outer membrane beta-barrel protein